MLIQFVTEWAVYRPGQVVAWDGAGSADVLIRRGIARPVSSPAADTIGREAPPASAVASKPKRVSRK